MHRLPLKSLAQACLCGNFITDALPVRMPVVNVREVRMLVLEFRMHVCMRVWLHPIPVKVMGVFVVLVMPMSVSVRHFCVLMLMGVMLGKV